MKDEVFSLILDGCYRQCEFNEGGQIKTQYLTTVNYSNNEMGPKSLASLKKLIPQLTNIQLHNVPFVNGFNHELLIQLTDELSYNTQMLMKIRISSINLNHRKIVDTLCQIITSTRVLQMINFSWAQFSCEHLSMIASCLCDRVLSLRSIDFSFNRLNFNEDLNPNDFYFSNKFIEHLNEFLGKSILINHLKLSGMNYN